MTAPSPDTTLDAIRREIDLIDDQILGLLQQRFAATRKVKATKASDGSIASSPFRPAREAAMLRRLIAKGGSALSADVLVRLWRVILSASTQVQAPVTLHVDAALEQDVTSRLLIAQHFFGMQVAVHSTPGLALETLNSRRGDLAILLAGSDWGLSFDPANAGSARVIGTLPIMAAGSHPQLLVFGHAEAQESGDDETLLVSPGRVPRLPTALWQIESDQCTLFSVPGFLGSQDPPVRDLVSRLPGARIAGRCPRPLKVLT